MNHAITVSDLVYVGLISFGVLVTVAAVVLMINVIKPWVD